MSSSRESESDTDTSSLYSLSDSLRRSLYRYQGSRRLQSSNEDYKFVPSQVELGHLPPPNLSSSPPPVVYVGVMDTSWPCDSVAVKLELLTSAMTELMYENKLYWEPREGELEERVLGEGSGPHRILDLGTSP